MRLERMPKGDSECILVLGMFDGVHLGHIALIEKALKLKAKCGLPVTVCTFDRHPLAVLRKGAAPPMLTTLTERARAMARLKVDTLCVLPFTKETAAISRKTFLADMVLAFRPKHIVVGFNYSFGRGGEGGGAYLSSMADTYGYRLHIVKPVVFEGETVSSTRIRQMLSEGQMLKANMLLTRAYGLTGRVEKGKQLARTMGFPTANLALPMLKALPRFGVYTALLREGNKVYPAIVNVGKHPTLPKGHGTVEAHVLTGNVQLYGKKVRIAFLSFLRDEIRFAGKAELKAQIGKDTLEAKAFFDRMYENAQNENDIIAGLQSVKSVLQ